MAKYNTVQLEILGTTARLTLNRPEVGNAINIELAVELGEAIREVEANLNCAVLVITAAGRIFCGGGDIRAMADAIDGAAFLGELARTASDAMMAIAKSRLVVISAVQGPAAGAGLALVLNSDLVLASPAATFHAAYASLGLTPDCGMSFLLPRVVGPRRATELAITQRHLNAKEALDWGLINVVHPTARLEASAMELANRMGASAQHALGPTKAMIGGDLREFAVALEREVETIMSMAEVAETVALMNAFRIHK